MFYKIIIIEDEPFLCDAYKLVFNQIEDENENYGFCLSIANNYDDGKREVLESLKINARNILALLDIRLGPIKNSLNQSGIDLGNELKLAAPNSKVIVCTSISDKYLYHTIFSKINPEGFFIKNEMDFFNTKRAILDVLAGGVFYSKSINDFLRKEANNVLPIDEIDRVLLHHLSQGMKIKELSEVLNLSISGIEWRQRKLSRIFNLESSEISGLVLKAREYNLI